MKISTTLGLLWLLTTVCFCPGYAQQSIQARINAAIASNASEVTIPPGEYRNEAFQNGNAHVILNDLRNFTIHATGVTMICGSAGSAIAIANCDNLRIDGLTIDYAPLPFTQGTVVSKGSESGGPYLDVAIHAGYPLADAITESKVELYDNQTRLLKSNVWTTYGAKVRKVSDRTYRIAHAGDVGNKAIVGEYVTLDMPSRNAHVVRVDQSTRVTLQDVAIRTGPVFGINEFRCSQNQYLNVRIEPGPPPSGATIARLKSSTADGIHSTSARVGPRIENCRLVNTGDDGIAIHGLYNYGLLVAGNKIGVLTRWGVSDIAVGDSILNLNADGTVHFKAKVVAAAPANAQELATMKANRDNLSFDIADFWTGYFVLTLDKSVAMTPGSKINSIGSQGNGFVVKNNYIFNKRARGILIKAGDGIIEGNTIDWVQMAAIAFSPEFYWMESGFSRNVKIIGNKLTRCGYNPDIWETVQAGTISVAHEGLSATRVQENIEIAHNSFDRCSGINVLVSSTKGLSIHDNTFTKVNADPRTHGGYFNLKGNSVVWLHNITDVNLAGNRVACTGTEDLLETVGVQNLTTSADGGIVCGDTPPGSGTGLTGKYFNGQNFEKFVWQRIDPQVNFTWGSGSPVAPVQPDNFSVRWIGEIQPAFSETYTFHVNSDNGRRLWINDQLIIDKWINDWNVGYSGSIALQAGQKYTIRLEYFEADGLASCQLEWESPRQPRQVVPKARLYPVQIGKGNGLNAVYFNGKNFETEVLRRKDAQVRFNWGEGSPAPEVQKNNFSARWTGFVQPLYSGTYTFYIRSDNGRRLWVNNQLLVDKWTEDWNVWYSATIQLQAGQKYPIQVEYFDNYGGASIELQWSSTHQNRQNIPQSQLYTTNTATLADAIASARQEVKTTRLHIYPNPANGWVTVDWSDLSSEPVTLTITTVQGEVVRQPWVQSEGRMEVSIGTLPSGVYILSVQTKDSVITERLVISH